MKTLPAAVVEEIKDTRRLWDRTWHSADQATKDVERIARLAYAEGRREGLEWAANECERIAADNTGYDGAIGSPVEWSLETNAMKFCAAHIRAALSTKEAK